jgi:hypothetical protein
VTQGRRSVTLAPLDDTVVLGHGKVVVGPPGSAVHSHSVITALGGEGPATSAVGRDDGGVDEVEVVVAHNARATRVGDLVPKIDADQTLTDIDVKAMAMAPVLAGIATRSRARMARPQARPSP